VIVCEGLNEHFPGWRIGTRRWKPRPPQSTEPTLPDFHLWDYVKHMVLSVKVNDINSMKQTIRGPDENVTADILT